MPKITYKESKGLVTEGGKGVDLVSGLTAGNGVNIRRPVVSLTSATKSVSVEESGTIFTLNRAAGVTVTLPAAEAGLYYDFYVETALNSNAYAVNAASSADKYTGKMMMIDIATKNSHIDLNDNVATIGWSVPHANDYQLSTNKTTTGGLAGSHWRFWCITDGLWSVDGTNICSSGATIAIPFAGG